MTQTQRLLTAADLAELPSELPSGTVLYELEDGVLQIMAPPGDIHGGVEARITGVLLVHGEWEGHGQVRSGDTGLILRRRPDTVRGGDVYFLTKEQLPPRRSREGYLETIPAIVVEVLSKNERPRKTARKVQEYLQAGVRAVWIVDPRRRTVTIHRPNQERVVLGEGDTLTAEGIIPDLAYPVAKLFEGL